MRVLHKQQRQTAYFGWDGDRLVHTEDASVIRQTVYEPNTFVPLLQLEQAKGHKTQAQWLMSQMQDDEDQDTMRLENMPRAQRELLQEALQMVMQPGSKALQGLPISEEASQRLSESVATLKAAQEASAKAHPVTIRHYLTDHLGTPLALVDANGQHKGQITWAASYNAWGDVKEEYNPHHIQQPIRFQGQQLDPDTGLHYNRFRYYDLVLGRYITQDPIGLFGGLNTSIYPLSPAAWIDPLGLTGCYVNFPDYPIEYSAGKTSTALGGHAGYLGYDSKGVTSYYEYGRYAPNSSGTIGAQLPSAEGNIRRLSMPNLSLDKDGKPTDESMKKLEEALSKKAGKGTKPVLTCDNKVDQSKSDEYFEELAKNKDREKYSWNPFSPNQCRSVAKDALKVGK